MANRSRLQPLARAVLRTQSDERLVRLVREGRDAAFEEIVRRYRQPLVAFAAAYAPTDPEDVVQESLTRSWQSLRESTGEMKLKPWLYTIVRNRALNAQRDTRRHEELPDDFDGVRQPVDIVLTNEELAHVVAAVGALPDQQREALVRSAVEGHSHEQIADAIGVSPGAVRQLIFRGRTAVRQGVGLMIPLPLVRALAENSPVAEAGAAAAGTGAVIAGGGAGASLATKAAVVAAVGAIAAGSGVAIQSARDSDPRRNSEPRERITNVSKPEPQRAATPAPTPAPAPVVQTTTTSDGDDSNRRPSDDSHRSGDDAAGSSGPSSSSGSGSDDDPSDDDSSGSGSDDDSSGSGSSGSGSDDDSSGSGSSGSGSDDDEPDVEEIEIEDEDNSGSGSSGSGSDSSDSSGSSSDSSGSGSGDELELDPDDD